VGGGGGGRPPPRGGAGGEARCPRLGAPGGWPRWPPEPYPWRGTWPAQGVAGRQTQTTGGRAGGGGEGGGGARPRHQLPHGTDPHTGARPSAAVACAVPRQAGRARCLGRQHLQALRVPARARTPGGSPKERRQHARVTARGGQRRRCGAPLAREAREERWRGGRGRGKEVASMRPARPPTTRLQIRRDALWGRARARVAYEPHSRRRATAAGGCAAAFPSNTGREGGPRAEREPVASAVRGASVESTRQQGRRAGRSAAYPRPPWQGPWQGWSVWLRLRVSVALPTLAQTRPRFAQRPRRLIGPNLPHLRQRPVCGGTRGSRAAGCDSRPALAE